MKVRDYTKKDSSVFNVNQLAKLENLFHLKQWMIDTGNELSTFERYIETLSKLTQDQQDFIVYYFFLLSLHRNSTSGCGIRPSFH